MLKERLQFVTEKFSTHTEMQERRREKEKACRKDQPT